MKTKYEFTLSSVSLLLVLLFSYTGISKLLHHQEFYLQLHSVALLQPLSLVISWFIPLSELCICLLLIIPEKRKTGMLLSLLLMTVFTLYIAIVLLFVQKLPCSCGGIIQTMSWSQHLVFNIAFTLLCVWALHIIRKQEIDNYINDVEEYLSRKSGDAENL